MDYKSWLSTMQKTIDTYLVSSSVVMLSKHIDSPMGSESIAVLQKQLDISFPIEISKFYSQAAEACDYQFLIELPYGFEYDGFSAVEITPEFCGGFSIQSPRNVPLLKAELADLLECNSEVVGTPAEREVLGFYSTPFSQGPDGGLLFFLRENDMFDSGVYWSSVSLQLSGTLLKKYCDTFEEWLTFLENSMYANPNWNNIQYWHNGDRLVVVPSHTRRLLEAIQQ